MKLLIMILMMCSTSFAKDKHPIYNQIIANKPSINRTYAMTLSNIIHRKAKQYDISANLMTAILMQESRYILEAKRCTTGMREFTLFEIVQHNSLCDDMYDGNVSEHIKCLENRPYYLESEVCTDYGIGQIHYSNFFAFTFNAKKLVTDLEYSVDAAFIMMNDMKKRYFSEEYYWWTRYNSSTPSKRKKYRGLVQRWM